MPTPSETASSGRPRLALATLYDEAFASIGWMCRNTLTRYGARHGHDVVVARSVDCGRPAPWAKVPFVLALLDQGYDYVFWVDADAVIVDAGHDVADLIDDSKDLHLVRHHLPECDAPVPNTGVFLIRNSTWSRNVLRQMWELEQYAEATWWENAAFIHLLGVEGFEEVGVHNPEGCTIDTSRLAWLPERWNRVRQRGEGGSTIIRHFAGRSRKHRLRNMPRWLNWPKALGHELNRKPIPFDLSEHGVHGATLEHAASPASIQQSNARAA